MADNDIQHIFGKFFDGETINTRKLQSGINKGEMEKCPKNLRKK